ncbi:MAG: 1-acyl-sn-glycerol-3-phosphate acyltransferase [Bacteroidota bacterium]|nr:MAG: 1-acyl-sn-glycerol-3-phosphate acyltransferase [Bacteroidota bacterium]
MFRTIFYFLYQPYKWLVFLPLAFLLTLLFGVLAVVFSLSINQKTGSFIGGAIWSRVLCFLTPVTVKVLGKENIDPGQSYIITPNHQSMYDIFVLYGWIGIDIRWMMKKELRRVPGVGFGSEKVGHIFLDRSNQRAALQSLSEAKQKLQGGTSVVIFPEGTRGNGQDLLAFKRGAFKLAIDLQLPILPVSIIGTNKILGAKAKFDIFPGRAVIQIHPPVDIAPYSDKNIQILMNLVQQTLAKQSKDTARD